MDVDSERHQGNADVLTGNSKELEKAAKGLSVPPIPSGISSLANRGAPAGDISEEPQEEENKNLDHIHIHSKRSRSHRHRHQRRSNVHSPSPSHPHSHSHSHSYSRPVVGHSRSRGHPIATARGGTPSCTRVVVVCLIMTIFLIPTFWLWKQAKKVEREKEENMREYIRIMSQIHQSKQRRTQVRGESAKLMASTVSSTTTLDPIGVGGSKQANVLDGQWPGIQKSLKLVHIRDGSQLHESIISPRNWDIPFASGPNGRSVVWAVFFYKPYVEELDFVAVANTGPKHACVACVDSFAAANNEEVSACLLPVCLDIAEPVVVFARQSKLWHQTWMPGSTFASLLSIVSSIATFAPPSKQTRHQLFICLNTILLLKTVLLLRPGMVCWFRTL